MALKRKQRHEEVVEMQMGPMIDMVFLLLVFFIVTAKPIKQESDISLGLPGAVEQTEAVDIPDEQRIVIQADGQVVLNDLAVDAPNDPNLPELVGILKKFKKASEYNKSDALVTLAPDDAVFHQRIVDVLNACAVAEIHGVTFADGGGGEDGGGVAF
ncbi:MAG: biopolymer transporter ExbD [Verrucomicrobiota bacterium]